jgi:hypothetical protein
VTVRGRVPGTSKGGWDPERILNEGMADTWNEIQKNGQGLEPEDVVRASTGRPSSKARTAAVAEPQQRQRTRPSQDTVEEADVDTYDTLVDDDEDAIGDDIEDDEDVDDEEDEDEDDAEDITDEVDSDDDDDAAAPEGDEDDEEEDDDERPRRRQQKPQAKSRKQRFSKNVQREIQREVQAQVQRTLRENEALRERESQRQQLDHANAKFLGEVLGSNEDLEHWKSIAMDRTKPQAQRDHAAAIYQGYERNRGFFENYKNGAWAVVQYQQAEQDTEAMKRMAQLKALDPRSSARGIEPRPCCMRTRSAWPLPRRSRTRRSRSSSGRTRPCEGSSKPALTVVASLAVLQRLHRVVAVAPLPCCSAGSDSRAHAQRTWDQGELVCPIPYR